MDYRGSVVYEAYVLPTNPVTDYRPSTTGIQPQDLTPANSSYSRSNSCGSNSCAALTLSSADARRFSDVQRQVADIIRGKVIVGHSLWLDLSGMPLHSSERGLA